MSDGGAPLGGEGPSPWPSVHVGRDLKRARREWLHTNGAGAYASSTLAGMHSRRYHGLLVAALDPPASRHVFLSHVDASIVLPAGAPSPFGDGAPSSRSRPVTWDLAKHQFPRVDPETGPFHLERFDQDPLPRFTYAVAGQTLEVTLGLVRGKNAAVLRYIWSGEDPVLLRLRPLLATRGFHELCREHGGMLQRVELRQGEMRVQPRRDLPRICFRFEGTFVGSPDWWRRFEYLAERERGLDFEEDLWTPGVFEVRLDRKPLYLVASVADLPDGEPEALLEATRRALLAEDPGPSRPLVERRLSLSAGSFRAPHAPRPAVLAGFPWFEVWGRDALVSLPGLYLATGKIDEALAVLRELRARSHEGLLPTRLPDGGGEPERSTVDATLWLFEAARELAQVLGEDHRACKDELLPWLREAFLSIVAGREHGPRVTAEGLIAAGRAGEGHDAPTWMHARAFGRPVTPRVGCAVELTALWARGCETLATLAHAHGDEDLAARAALAGEKARRAFHDRFWCHDTDYPFDVVSEAPAGEAFYADASVRPNAVLALAVDPACFTPERAERVLARAERELLTPAGLRTLSPADPRYEGRYQGGVEERDRAAHQGTVWPFLLGFYARAAIRHGRDLHALDRLVEGAAENQLALGHVPEMADGDAPHSPAGCVAQAASVAELLRVLRSDLPAARGRR